MRETLDSILSLSDHSGAVVERISYTAYGQPTFTNAAGTTLSSSAKATRYTYTGREWDPSLQLHHFIARWMSGVSGRFLGREQFGFVDSFNIYSALLQGVLRRTDPSGDWERDPEGPEWHHNYPKDDARLKPIWKRLNIDPHAEECGCLMLGKHHAKVHPNYRNDLYARIVEFEKGPPPRAISRVEVEKIISGLKGSPPYKQFFDNSRPTCCNYNDWQKLKKIPKQKQRMWDMPNEIDTLHDLNADLLKKPDAHRALKTLAKFLAVAPTLFGAANCVDGACDEELNSLFAASRRLIANRRSPEGLSACVGYFSAWNGLANCAGFEQPIATHAMIQKMCLESYTN